MANAILTIIICIFLFVMLVASIYTILLIRRKNYDSFIRRHNKLVKKLHLS